MKKKNYKFTIFLFFYIKKNPLRDTIATISLMKNPPRFSISMYSSGVWLSTSSKYFFNRVNFEKLGRRGVKNSANSFYISDLFQYNVRQLLGKSSV